MNRPGPEHQFGWHDAVVVDGVKVLILARHHRRTRLPRSHEFARQVSRGRPLAMVEEIDHEWSLVAGGRHLGTMRQNPNGSWSLGRAVVRAADIRAAAEAIARRLAPIPAR